MLIAHLLTELLKNLRVFEIGIGGKDEAFHNTPKSCGMVLYICDDNMRGTDIRLGTVRPPVLVHLITALQVEQFVDCRRRSNVNVDLRSVRSHMPLLERTDLVIPHPCRFHGSGGNLVKHFKVHVHNNCPFFDKWGGCFGNSTAEPPSL